MMGDLDRARDALLSIPHDLPRPEWHAVGRAAIAAGLTVDDIVSWSAGASNFKSEQDVRAAFRTIKPDGGTGPKTLYRAALDNGWNPPKQDVPQQQAQQAPRTAQAVPNVQTEPQGLSDWAQRLWDHECKPLYSAALDYLKYRHCAIPPEDGDLRYHPALKHPSGYVGPCLVALITAVRTQKPLSLHRTWITPTGKASVEPARMLLKDHPIKNGVIRLWPDDHVNALLGIAEGIETALSLAWAPMPTWATIDAGHLGKFPVLNGIGTLVIAQDNDVAGIAASATCAARWAAAGRDVRVTRQTSNDLNDALTEVSP